MKLESIERLLSTICEYSTVNITQVFTRDDVGMIRVTCIPLTKTLELTYLQEDKVELYESVSEAANVISQQIHPN